MEREREGEEEGEGEGGRGRGRGRGGEGRGGEGGGREGEREHTSQVLITQKHTPSIYKHTQYSYMVAGDSNADAAVIVLCRDKNVSLATGMVVQHLSY